MEIMFSIIMPVYNAVNFIQKAIDSIRKQSYSNFELILVDDGSTDGSGAVCDAYEQLDIRIKVFHKENKGICSARNLGLNIAVGKFIGFMDNDDILDENALRDNYELINQYDVDWIKFGKTEILLQNETVLNIQRSRFVKKLYHHEEIMNYLLKLRTQNTMTFVWDSFIRREIIETFQIRFDETFRLGNEDIDFCEQCVAYVNRLFVNPVCYYYHYSRIGISTSSIYSREKIDSYLYLLKKSNQRYTEYNINIEKNKDDYSLLVTKLVIANTCQVLDKAGKTLDFHEKKEVLKKMKKATELKIFCNLKNVKLVHKSIKLCLYRFLFLCNLYGVLLFTDYILRKTVYRIRLLRNIFKRKMNR